MRLHKNASGRVQEKPHRHITEKIRFGLQPEKSGAILDLAKSKMGYLKRYLNG